MAWDDIEKDLINKLVDKRHFAGLQRQSELAEDFAKLIALLEEKQKSPFDTIELECFESLAECCKSFKEGGHWQCGDPCNNRYFYRIETVESFFYKHKQYLHTDYENSDHILLNVPENSQGETWQAVYERIFQTLCTHYNNKPGWQSLERLVSRYYGHRGFTWWTNDFKFEEVGKFPERFSGTDLSVEHRWVLEFAFQVGIASDWLSDYLLFLRLDSTKMDENNIKIPSIIDALLQPIFSPQQFYQHSRWGKAFHLKDPIHPQYREYVIKQVPVEAVEYIPVRIDTKSLNDINPKARLDNEMLNALIKNI
jgi:hypothetical protein